jgi:hypothetical protein
VGLLTPRPPPLATGQARSGSEGCARCAARATAPSPRGKQEATEWQEKEVSHPRHRQMKARRCSLPAGFSELEEFDRGAVVDDHRHPHTPGQGARRTQNLLALECHLEVVHLEGEMWHGSDELGHLTVRLESHPFDPVRAGVEPGHVDLEVGEVPLPGPWNLTGHAEVVVPPAPLRDGGRRLVVAPLARQPVCNSSVVPLPHGPSSQPLRRETSGTPMTPEICADSSAFGEPVKARALSGSSALKSITTRLGSEVSRRR